MKELFENSGYFGIILTLFGYWIGVEVNKKYKYTFLNPILIASAFIIMFLLFSNIKYSEYKAGTASISLLLTPSTICLAVPMYKQFNILKKYRRAVLLSVLVGSVCAILTVILSSMLFGFNCSWSFK